MAGLDGLNHRWLQDDVVKLQLQEVGGNLGMIGSTADPQQIRKWFVALTIFRQKADVKRALEDQLSAARKRLDISALVQWIISLKFQCEDSPGEFPFCLDEREFAYYANKEFGGEIRNIVGIYKPPSFYKALAQDIFGFGFGFGVGAGVVATAAIPEEAGAAALSLPVLATAGARAAVSATAGAVTSRLMPGGAFDASRKRRLWPRYLTDYQRRTLL